MKIAGGNCGRCAFALFDNPLRSQRNPRGAVSGAAFGGVMSEGRDSCEELKARHDGQLRYFVDALEGGDAWRVRGTETACFKLKVADGRERGRCRYRGAAGICLRRKRQLI